MWREGRSATEVMQISGYIWQRFWQGHLWENLPFYGKMQLPALEAQSTVWSLLWGVSSAPRPPGAIWRRRVSQHLPLEDIAPVLLGGCQWASWLGLSSANISKPQIILMYKSLIFYFFKLLLALFLRSEDWKTGIQQYWKYTLCLFPLAVKSCSRITRTIRAVGNW